jgi:hypothetical protein
MDAILKLTSILQIVEQSLQQSSNFQRSIKVMKTIVRAFVLGVFAAGASAAVVSSHSNTFVPSHQAMSASMPIPFCPPGNTCSQLPPAK